MVFWNEIFIAQQNEFCWLNLVTSRKLIFRMNCLLEVPSMLWTSSSVTPELLQFFYEPACVLTPNCTSLCAIFYVGTLEHRGCLCRCHLCCKLKNGRLFLCSLCSMFLITGTTWVTGSQWQHAKLCCSLPEIYNPQYYSFASWAWLCLGDCCIAVSSVPGHFTFWSAAYILYSLLSLICILLQLGPAALQKKVKIVLCLLHATYRGFKSRLWRLQTDNSDMLTDWSLYHLSFEVGRTVPMCYVPKTGFVKWIRRTIAHTWKQNKSRFR